jgi:hypothetical protein
MNADLRRPPAAAVWLLRNLCSKSYAESLGGDLLERFHEGQSDEWFWRQVAIAILVSAWNEARPRWFHVAFAITGTAVLFAPIVGSLSFNLAFYLGSWTGVAVVYRFRRWPDSSRASGVDATGGRAICLHQPANLMERRRSDCADLYPGVRRVRTAEGCRLGLASEIRDLPLRVSANHGLCSIASRSVRRLSVGTPTRSVTVARSALRRDSYGARAPQRHEIAATRLH